MARDVDVLTETVIRRPREEVSAYAGDPSNAPAWYANISFFEWQTAPPVDVPGSLSVALWATRCTGEAPTTRSLFRKRNPSREHRRTGQVPLVRRPVRPAR